MKQNISIGVKGVAKFMTATHFGQRKVVRDYKYPDPSGRAQAAYYRDAVKAITEYHSEDRDQIWLKTRAAKLEKQALVAGGQRGSRLKNNARVLRDYAKYFADKDYEVLEALALKMIYGPVSVSTSPDLHVIENGLEKVIKFEFANRKLDERVPKIVTAAMHDAARAKGLDFKCSQIEYIDIAGGTVYKAPKAVKRMLDDVRAAVETISNIWPNIDN